MILTKQNEREVPYDKEKFLKWCVNFQSMSMSTSNAYVSSIRTAFDVLYSEEDPVFHDLKKAFSLSNKGLGIEQRFIALEQAYSELKARIEVMEEYGDVKLNEFNSRMQSGEEKDAPKEMWVRAGKTYCRYIRNRIDRLKQKYGIPLEIEDDQSIFLEIPLARQFKQYLKSKGRGYERNSIYTYNSVLKRLYNLFFRRILKQDVLQGIERIINAGVPVIPFFDKLQDRINNEIANPTIPDLSKDDLKRGNVAFTLYREFIEDFIGHSEKYDMERI